MVPPFAEPAPMAAVSDRSFSRHGGVPWPRPTQPAPRVDPAFLWRAALESWWRISGKNVLRKRVSARAGLSGLLRLHV